MARLESIPATDFEDITWRWVLWPDELLRETFDDLREELGDDFDPPQLAVDVVSRGRLVGLISWWLGPTRSQDVFAPSDDRDDEGDEVEQLFTRLDDATVWLLCADRGLDHLAMMEGLRHLRRMKQPELRIQLARRHGWRCHICGEVFPAKLREAARYTPMSPDPMFPDIEHVVPKRSGGSHWWSNLRLAHRCCNLAKKDLDPDGDEDAQVILRNRVDNYDTLSPTQQQRVGRQLLRFEPLRVGNP